MTELFIHLYNGSMAAGWLVLALVLLRPLLKRAPRWICVALWGVVAVRLLCPVFPESSVSLIPVEHVLDPQIMAEATEEVKSGIVVIREIFDPNFNWRESLRVPDGANPLQVNIPYAAFGCLIWASVLSLYAFVSWVLLKRRVRTAVLLRDNIYQSEWVKMPFILGLVKPKIYLPFDLDDGELPYILAHEQAHIQRKDHWWKFIGFVLMALSLSCNPWLCVAYILLCRDIEVACDEKVIKQLKPCQRADYAQALLNCSTGKLRMRACPVAFGEVGVKSRIKHVLKYKKPSIWFLVLTGTVCVLLVACFLTSPTRSTYAAKPQQNLCAAGKLVAFFGETRALPENGAQKFSEIRMGTEGLQVYRGNEGLHSFPFVQIRQLTREEFVKELTLPDDIWGYWNREGNFEPNKAVPSCQQITAYMYREKETDAIPEYIIYYFDGQPGWFAASDYAYESYGVPREIYQLQQAKSTNIRPMVLYIRNGGSFALEDYEAELADPYFQTMYSYGAVENYRQAGNAGIQAIADRFAEDYGSQLPFNSRGCDVMYDAENDAWYVRLNEFFLSTSSGGGYVAILNSDGNVLAVWDEK